MKKGFQLISQDPESRARLGVYHTAHGSFETPIFMPVGTQAAIKGLTTDQVKSLGAQIILGNTYHLFLRPGHELIKDLGGLHQYMNWQGPILTDSGGFQVFSLSKLRKIKPEGVEFQSHLDGSKHLLSPEKVIEIQEALGSDIMMPLDECLPYPSTEADTQKSMELTLKWEASCLQARTKANQSLFAIVQGGTYKPLRQECAERMVACEVQNEHLGQTLTYDGFAIGGLSVGEPMDLAYEVVDYTEPYLPKNKARYLMGVGLPIDILTCIDLGIDMFDCVIPTRNARNGQLFTDQGAFNIRNSQFHKDDRPISELCTCYTCKNYSRAYLRHISLAKEILSAVLNSIHNLHYYLNLLSQARLAIKEGSYRQFFNEYKKMQE